MRFDDMPVPAEQNGVDSHRNQWTVPRRDSFDDPVPPSRPGRPDYGLNRPAAFGPTQDARAAAYGRHAARRGDIPPDLPLVAPGGHLGPAQRMRHAARNHTGVAALTAGVLGVGVSASMFGFALFAVPSAAPPGSTAALSPQAPQAVTIAGASGSSTQHTGYTGTHRKPEQAPSTLHLRHPSAGIPTAAASATLPSGAPSSAGTAGGSTAPARGSSSAPAPAPRTSSPSPTRSSGGGGTSTHTGGGTHTGSGHGTGGNGGAGGLLGGLTGLVGSLTGSL